jgi:hypothetical protein
MNNYRFLIKVRDIIIEIAVIIYANHLCHESLSQEQQSWLFIIAIMLTMLAVPFLLINLLILGRHFLPRLRRFAVQFIEEE